MTEPLRNHCDHGGATTVYAVQVPQWHRASGVTGGRRSAVMTILRDATEINAGLEFGQFEGKASWP